MVQAPQPCIQLLHIRYHVETGQRLQEALGFRHLRIRLQRVRSHGAHSIVQRILLKSKIENAPQFIGSLSEIEIR